MKYLDQIEARAEAATPGPWTTNGAGEVSQHWSCPQPWKTVVGTEVACMAYCYGGSAKGVERDEDAEFIAAARTDVPALVDALRAVLELHAERSWGCAVCEEQDQVLPWPCPTVETIRQHLGEATA